MRFTKRIYSLYGSLIFGLSFIILLPFFLLTIQIPQWRKYGRRLNGLWSRAFFFLIFQKVSIQNKEILKREKQYILAANHFSYIDIPVMGLLAGEALFVGKSSLGKVPIFGYMFKKLHIAVDRASFRSRGETLRRTKEAIDHGCSIIIFPEGGIYSNNIPQMAHFKDGAFKVAFEKQIPIIPVTLSYNHLILPDDKKFLLSYKPVKVVVHSPIFPEGNEKEAVAAMKSECYSVIQNQLDADNTSSHHLATHNR